MGVDAEMFVRKLWQRPPPEEVKAWNVEALDLFGGSVFTLVKRLGEGEQAKCWLDAGGDGVEDHDGYAYQTSALPIYVMETSYAQDGPTIVPDEGEFFVRIRLWSRYYGPGYERGNFPAIYMVAAWARRRIGGEVWYGGDSSGIVAEPFDFEGLLEHFLENGHRPYRGVFTGKTRSCPEGGEWKQYGFGRNYEAYSCNLCGVGVESRDGGKTFTRVEV